MLLAPRFFTSKTKIANQDNRNFQSSSSINRIEEKPPPDTSDHVSDSTVTSTLPSPATHIPITGAYSLRPVPRGHVDSKCHEAGYDALLTAQVRLSRSR